MKTLRREIHPQVRVLDEKAGLVEYIASNETLDSYREVVRADGWRFDNFKKNAPFVDSHNYGSVEHLLGSVVDFRVEKRQLVETVKWAVDVPENKLAALGFAMTKAGHLKAVSVGFMPTRYVSKWDTDKKGWIEALAQIGMHEESGVRCIYLEQQQLELSACVLGANPDAVARAYKAGVLDDSALELFSSEYAKRATTNPADGPAAAELVRQRARTAFLLEIQQQTSKL